MTVFRTNPMMPVNPVGMGIILEPKSPKSVFPESRRDDISRQRVRDRNIGRMAPPSHAHRWSRGLHFAGWKMYSDAIPYGIRLGLMDALAINRSIPTEFRKTIRFFSRP